MTDPFQLPEPASREVIMITVLPHQHEMTLKIEDGLRLEVEYGNTRINVDLPTNHGFTSAINPDVPLSLTPRIRAVRLGPDELADINAKVKDALASSKSGSP